MGAKKEGKRRKKRGKEDKKEEEKREMIVSIHYIVNIQFVLYVLPVFNMVIKLYFSPQILSGTYMA